MLAYSDYMVCRHRRRDLDAVSWQRRREQESEQDVPATTSGFSEGIEQAYISQIRI